MDMKTVNEKAQILVNEKKALSMAEARRYVQYGRFDKLMKSKETEMENQIKDCLVVYTSDTETIIMMKSNEKEQKAMYFMVNGCRKIKDYKREETPALSVAATMKIFIG